MKYTQEWRELFHDIVLTMDYQEEGKLPIVKITRRMHNDLCDIAGGKESTHLVTDTEFPHIAFHALRMGLNTDEWYVYVTISPGPGEDPPPTGALYWHKVHAHYTALVCKLGMNNNQKRVVLEFLHEVEIMWDAYAGEVFNIDIDARTHKVLIDTRYQYFTETPGKYWRWHKAGVDGQISVCVGRRTVSAYGRVKLDSSNLVCIAVPRVTNGP